MSCKLALQTLIIALLGLTANATASTVDVRVVDPNGEPVEGVIVFSPDPKAVVDRVQAPTAIMDQINKEFVPHVLAIPKGTEVEFPNSDTTAHHVYSFSKPNDFTLPLYKGKQHKPVRFEHDGVVAVGCNIHDHMLGYIVVIEGRTFAVTDAQGFARLNVESRDDASRDVVIWSPLIRDAQSSLIRNIKLASGNDVVFQLEKRLLAPFGRQTGSVAWTGY